MIFSNTGVALLAYMDGINRTTLGGVVLGAAAAAASAVYKVMLFHILWNLFIDFFIFIYIHLENKDKNLRITWILFIKQVAFKRVVGDVSFCQTAMFLSSIGLCGTVLYWPIILLLHFTGIGKLESIAMDTNIRWLLSYNLRENG